MCFGTRSVHTWRSEALQHEPLQELAGHANLSTPQRYMHLSPAAIEGAIRLLDRLSPASNFGDIVETADH